MSWDNRPPKGPFWDGQRNNPNNNNVDEVINNLQKMFQERFPGGKLSYVIAALIAIGWLLSTCVFVVNPQEAAVVQRFGKVHRVLGPGPQLKFPVPIETHIVENVTTIRRIEIGFRTLEAGPPARYHTVKKESLMLTEDENIVDVQFTVQYYVKDLEGYLFDVTDPHETIKKAAESAIRAVIGHSFVDDALTTGKAEIELKTKELLQEILDRYKTGTYVENVKLQDVHPPDPVKDAFKDVTSAKEDKEKLIREAEGYANNLIPKARGEAEQKINEAKGYAKEVVLVAEGKAARFESLYAEYTQAKDVTRERIRIETMEQVLPNIQKVLADPALGKNFLPFLPLQGAQNRIMTNDVTQSRQP